MTFFTDYQAELSESNVAKLAEKLASVINAPFWIALKGDLGAGKTFFAQKLIFAAGYSGKVASPTYGLVSEYPTKHYLMAHFDLYRLNDPEELEFIGMRDLASENIVALVEWPERAGDWLPPFDVELSIEHATNSRIYQWRSLSSRGEAVYNALCGASE